MVTRRYTIHPPQLQGRPWDEAAQELQRFLLYLMSANDSGQAGAGIVGVVGGTIDHGSIGGLADDDHLQYLKEKLFGGLAAEIPLHTHASGAEAGTIDHGVLTGLTDDDHTQYLKEKASGGLAAEIPVHTHASAAEAGTISHPAIADRSTAAAHPATAVTFTPAGSLTSVTVQAAIEELDREVAIVTKSAAYLATSADYVILVNAAGAPVSISLPAAASNVGRRYIIKKIDSTANVVTIDPNAAELLDGAATQDLLRQYEVLDIVCDGTGWSVT